MSLALGRRLGAYTLAGFRTRPTTSVNFRPHCSRQLSLKSGAIRQPRRLGLAVAGGVVVGLAYLLVPHRYADASEDKDKIRRTSSFGALVRSYIVYSMCEFPTLIDNAPAMLNFVTSIPIVKNIAELFVRVTFFDQVCNKNR
jgi:hypothetical protein